MQPTMKQEQFPLIKFDKVAVEDRNATIEAGRRITKDVDMVFIKQIGEKDETMRNAQEWINQLYDKAMGSNGNRPSIPMEWYEFAKKSYDNWQKGYEAPRTGTPVREWPILTPAQIQNLHSMNTFTVEEISTWTENAVVMYGMGGRELRDKARLWLESGDAKAEQIQALQVENKSLKQKMEELADQVRALQEGAKEEKKLGRPRKESAEA
jgi:hypothetical protein